MKKLIFVACLTAVLLGTVCSLPNIWKSTLPHAEVVAIDVIEYADYISAAGEIVCYGGKTYVTAFIPENQIYSVEVGQKTIITGNAFPDTEYSATVTEISPKATKLIIGTSQNVVVEAKIEFDGADDTIRPGYSAKVRILTDEPKPIAVLSYEAIKSDENGNEYVYVFNNGIAVKKEVETGLETSDGVEITYGLSGEDRIITSADSIADGEYVVID